MTASHIWGEHCFLSEYPEPSEQVAGSVASGPAEPSLAPAVSQLDGAMRPDSCGVRVSLGTIQEMSRAFDEPNCSPTRKARETQIQKNYQLAEKNRYLHSGAKRFLEFLEGQHKSLAQATIRDLEQWACTPITSGPSQGRLPSVRTFEGAKGLCTFAAKIGYIDAQRAKNLAECNRPQLDRNLLRSALQNPMLTREECEYHIRLNYQSAEKDSNLQAGASAFLAYLESQEKSLAEVTTSDLERWAQTPVTTRRGRDVVPSARAFEGAKALCALAAEVGYIDAQRAKGLAECKRAQLDLDSLRKQLQNPTLTGKEREYQVRLSYQSLQDNPNREAGANAFLAFIESADIPLAEVSKSDLKQWALTPITIGNGKNHVPDKQAFEGAKALCELAAKLGHIDAQRAKEIAECPRPHFEVNFLRTVLENPALTLKERDEQICLNFQSWEKDSNRQGGANGIMGYLDSKLRSLSELTANDVQQWALTPLVTGKSKGSLPSVKAFEGVKALCALAAEVGHIDAQRAQEVAACRRPQGDVGLLRTVLENPALTREEREHHIRFHYQIAEKNFHHQTGANAFLTYLRSIEMPLAEVGTSDLKQWALTPIASGKHTSNVPSPAAFEGAKRLCALAAEVGHIDAQRAQELAQCPRPSFGVDYLRTVLQNPALSRKECESHIRLNYQSVQKNGHFINGANRFLAYLETQSISLAEVTKSEVQQWALTPFINPHGKGTLPNRAAFEGAKALCALAAEVGYLDELRAKDIAECSRPHFDVDFLRTVLESPALTSKEREYQIRLNYLSTEKDLHRQSGANGILAYLESQDKPLGEVTKNDVEQWALTIIPTGRGKGTLPSRQAFWGAQALCALAATVGHIDAQRAQAIAACPYPQLSLVSISTGTRSEGGNQAATSSPAMLKRANKRRRGDDQENSGGS